VATYGLPLDVDDPTIPISFSDPPPGISFSPLKRSVRRCSTALVGGPTSKTNEIEPIVVPALLLLNLIGFIIGHTGAVIKISVLGQVFQGPIELPDIATFSVITSTKQLADSGAMVLVLLIGSFSIVWPYIKLLLMSLCWFAPPSRLGRKRRGDILEFLDRAGKWSMIELSFITIILDIQVNSPDNTVTFSP